ncbi:MAG: M23 family metallopeptidase [Vicinamibacterales bacterium]
MSSLLRFIVAVSILALIIVGVGWISAGRAAGPDIRIRQPGDFIGQDTTLDLAVEAPDGLLSALDVTVEQGGTSFPVYSLNAPLNEGATQDSAESLYVMRPIGRSAIADLRTGDARIVVRAARPVLYGFRQAESVVTKDVQVRLEPPQVTVLSTFHYVNHGGAELVVYRVGPDDVTSGVRVGEHTYPGYPGSAAGLGGDAGVRVAFFALLHDQDLATPIEVVAEDPAGNTTAVPLDHRVFPKAFARSRITIDDRFLSRVIPAMAAANPDLNLATAPEALVDSFLRVNRDLRRENNQTLVELAGRTASEMFWRDAFQPLGNASVEAGFADYRTYLHDGEEIDQQVHLGFDLAVTAQVPITAAQRGRVLHAGNLGIYGTAVVLDHGLGVQSLYAHLSSVGVAPDELVDKGAVIGRSGMTGLAAGDHLHFTVLLQGQAVNPVEWWDPKWIQDRVLRKLDEAGRVR